MDRNIWEDLKLHGGNSNPNSNQKLDLNSNSNSNSLNQLTDLLERNNFIRADIILSIGIYKQINNFQHKYINDKLFSLEKSKSKSKS